jgi:hypothetical protein
MGFAPIPVVTELPRSLGPPTVVLVHRTSDNPAGAPDHLISSVSVFFTLPKSVSPVTQILQHIGGTSMRKQLPYLGRQKPLPINSKKFLKEDTSSQGFSLGFLP